MIHIGQVIEFLIWAMITLSVLLIGFWMYLMFERLKEVARQRKIDLYIKGKQQKWYRYFRGEEPFTDELIPKNKYEIQGIEELFLVYLQNLSNTGMKEKIKQFSNRYLKQYYQKLLGSRKWSLKMNALYRIADFQLSSLADECYALEKRRLTHEESFQLLKLYSMFNPENFIEKIKAIPLSEFEYKKLLTGLDSETYEELQRRFHEMPVTCQYSMIDTIGLKRDMDSIPFLEAKLESDDPEIRIRSLKAIHEIGIILHLDKYVPFVSSDIWQERLMAAKLLQNVSLKDSLPYLKKLMEDESWQVRSQVARALGKTPVDI